MYNITKLVHLTGRLFRLVEQGGEEPKQFSTITVAISQLHKGASV